MGNMMFNRRLGTASDPDAELSKIYCLNLTFLKILLTLVHDEANYKKSEYRIFKQHMYGGPKGLGDPNYRELSKMEEARRKIKGRDSQFFLLQKICCRKKQLILRILEMYRI